MRDTLRAEGAQATAPAVNAQVSDALLRTRAADTGPQIAILKYRRSTKAFQEIFAQSPQLAARRSALEANGFHFVLEAGAKVFVKPEHYVATMRTISAEGIQLFSSHVVVEADLADHVESLVQRVHQGVYLQDARTTAIGYPCHFRIDRTFINIKVASSLRSSTAEGPKTV